VSQDKSNSVNCFRCKHFVVTWDPTFPRSCAFFGFKTKGEMPSVSVQNSSGAPCQAFEEKSSAKK